MKTIFKLGLTALLFAFSMSGFAQSESKKIRIDPGSAQSLDGTSLLGEVIYTPLETTKESQFNMVNQVVVTDSEFIILSMMDQSIYLFELNGKFRRKFSLSNKKNIIQSPWSFTYDKEKKEITVAYVTFDKNEIYSLTGEKLRENTNEDQIFQQYKFSSGAVAQSTLLPVFPGLDTKDRKESNFGLKVKSSSGETLKEYFESDTRKIRAGLFANYLLHNYFSVDKKTGDVMYTRPLDFSIYELNEKSLTKRYDFIFPFTSILNDNEIEELKTGDVMTNMTRFMDRTNRVASIDFIRDSGPYLFFKLNHMNQPGPYCIFNKETGDLYSLTGYLVNKLPIMLDNMQQSPVFFTENSFYGSIDAGSIYGILTDKKNKEVSFPESLKNLKRSDNPVIIQVKTQF